MSIQYNPSYNPSYNRTGAYPTAQPVQAQPVQAQPVYANGKLNGNVYVAQPVEPGIRYGGAPPAQVIYSGQQYTGATYQPYGQGVYANPPAQPYYANGGYGNHNQMYRDMQSEEQMRYYAQQQRRRQELADEMCCLAGLTAGCCLCLALD